jgi:hypothetical protein
MSSFPFNHRLPRDETHLNVMQRTADFHDAIANDRFPEGGW